MKGVNLLCVSEEGDLQVMFAAQDVELLVVSDLDLVFGEGKDAIPPLERAVLPGLGGCLVTGVGSGESVVYADLVGEEVADDGDGFFLEPGGTFGES